jgi:TPP-dependent indolepyruvate ferredoxin oxidoreductase alpha subunit
MPILADARVQVLRSAPLNSWVALSDDETTLITTGASYEEVAQKLDEMRNEDAVILKTPSQWLPLSV